MIFSPLGDSLPSVADDDYERYWKTVRPNRRESPPAPPEVTPASDEVHLPQWVLDHESIIRNQELTRINSSLIGGFDHNAAIRNLELPRDDADLFIPDHTGSEGNRSEFERQATIRSRVWLGEVRRHLPRTTTAAALWTRASEVISSRVSVYSHTQGANLEGVDNIIRQELEPIVTLVRRDEEGTLPEALNHLINPSPTIRAVRRNLGLGLTTEELLTRVMNEVNPGESSVALAIQQENRIQGLLNRVELEIPVRFQASWVNQDISNSPQLTNLVNAFTALGIPVDVFLELQRDRLATSTLEITIENQTIRIESSNGINNVRIFDRIDQL